MNLYPFKSTKDGIEIYVRLTPKSAHNRVQGLFYDPSQKPFLKISVTAPPVDGLANKALIEFLAEKCGCPKSSVILLKGTTDRYKTLFIKDGIEEILQQKLLP
jgi:hypothetical protein